MPLTYFQPSQVDSTFNGYLRNRIINGAMMIDQRNGGASVTPTAGGFFLDRWNLNLSVASKLSIQQNAGGVVGPSGFSNYAGITSTSSYSVGASEFFDFFQPIEGFNFSDAAWGTIYAQPVTLSFWARSSLTGTFSGYALNASGNRVYNFSYSIPAANTWTKISVTIAADTGGTWTGATNGVGVYIVPVSFGAGSSTLTSTQNTWQTGAFRGVTGQTNLVGTNGATFYITGVQFEIGSVATPFERRLYNQELAMCQRYFVKIVNPNLRGVFNTSSLANRCGIVLPVTMRAQPTLSASGTANIYDGNNISSFTSANVVAAYNSANAVEIDLTGLSAVFAQYRMAVCYIDASFTFALSINAEL